MLLSGTKPRLGVDFLCTRGKPEDYWGFVAKKGETELRLPLGFSMEQFIFVPRLPCLIIICMPCSGKYRPGSPSLGVFCHTIEMGEKIFRQVDSSSLPRLEARMYSFASWRDGDR